MRIKIVQLEGQDERSLSAKQALAGQADVKLVQTPSVDRFRQAITSGDVDLFLCPPFELVHDGITLLETLSSVHPHVPVVILASEEEKVAVLRRSNLRVWDVISLSELNRLPLCVVRAVESKRVREQLEAELTQARDLLMSCQKNIAVGRLLVSIAHEINNPLEAISNPLYLGQRNVTDEEEIRRCLQMAEEELQRVGEITKQMLHFHRDSRGPQEISLPEVIESVLVLYQNRLNRRSIQVSKQYRSHARLIAHPGELRQAFSNFVANAIDAMPQGGKLNFRIRQENRCKLSVTIADSGHGISRNGIRRLGELLFTTKGEAGTGLGLWVTYRIIAKYGGSIRVYSSTRAGKSGTVFKLCFVDADFVTPVQDQDRATEITTKSEGRQETRNAGTQVDQEKDQRTA